MPRDVSVFALVIVDVDTVSARSFEEEANIWTVSADVAEGVTQTLGYPPKICELRRAMIGLSDSDHLSDKRRTDDGGAVICIDRAQSSVIVDGERYTLSDYELKVFELLCERTGEAVSRDEINALLGACGGNIGDVYICRLRKKLEADGARRLIYTVRGKGYMIKHGVLKK